MKTKLILTAALGLCCAALFGQQQPVVAVAPFEAVSGVSKEDASAITRVFFTRLGNTKEVKLVDRSLVERVLKEHKFQLDDWSDGKKTAELGKVLNANWIVRGELGKLGSKILVTAHLYDINTFQYMAGSDVQLAHVDEAYDKMGPLVTGLVQTIAGSGGVQPASAPARPAAAPSRAAPANMVWVEGGSFQMGSNNGRDDEKPVHRVTVKSFYMGKYPVTQKEWREVIGTTVQQQWDKTKTDESWWGMAGEGDNYPMYYVSWYDAVDYCNKLSRKEGLTPAYRGSGDGINCDWNANGYRLPTEAEWEYAAKGGNGSPGNYEYSGSSDVNAVAWYMENSRGETYLAGGKAPNTLGLYDMSGNVSEWCWDWEGDYSGEAQTGPVGASSGSFRVVRGGDWLFTTAFVRSACRDGGSPFYRNYNIGFRLVRP